MLEELLKRYGLRAYSPWYMGIGGRVFCHFFASQAYYDDPISVRKAFEEKGYELSLTHGGKLMIRSSVERQLDISRVCNAYEIP